MVTQKNRKFIKCAKNDSAKINGFYNNSNVIRIDKKLRGVGLVPYSAFEFSKVRRKARTSATLQLL